MAGTPSEAPSSNEAPSGSVTACRAGTVVHSAAVPQRRPARGTHSPTPPPPGADRLDDPGAILVRDLVVVDGPRHRPGPGLVVGGVDAGGVHADQDLTRSR